MTNNDLEINKRIESIPEQNRLKFFCDLLKLIDLAHTGDYDNYEL